MGAALALSRNATSPTASHARFIVSMVRSRAGASATPTSSRTRIVRIDRLYASRDISVSWRSRAQVPPSTSWPTTSSGVPSTRKNLPEPVQRGLKTCIRSVAEARGWEVKELEVMPDHIHLFIGAPPSESPTGIVKVLKGTTSGVMFREHPTLRFTFRHGHLWSPSYYVGSVGHVSEETVARYVREQKLRVVGRPKGWRASSPQ